MRARLPARYSQSARNKAAFDAAVHEESQRLFHEYDSYTIDIVMIANILALIESEGWGTGKTATKIPRHIENVRKTIDDACERYGHDCAMTALCARLREYGVEYERRCENG